MIKEFAFDPECAPNLDAFRRITDQCALHLGRIISDFPRGRWAVMVLKHLNPRSYQEKQQLTEALTQLGRRGGLLEMGRRYENQKWLINALREHAQRPFHCIITSEADQGQDAMVNVGQLEPNTRQWNIETEDRIPRTADKIVECMQSLIQYSRQLLLIDPHFTPDTARYQKSLRAILRAAHAGNRNFDRIEIHAKVCCRDHADELERRRWAQLFEDACRLHLPRCVPERVPITVFLWDERINGDEFHVRLLLTEIGGIRIDKGLDLGEEGQTTDVGLVAPRVYQRRWGDFQRDATTFNLNRQIRIIGANR